MPASKVGEAYIELQARMAKFESQLRSAEVMTGKSVSKMQAKFQALAPTFKKVGMGMAVAGGAITAALGLTIKSSMSFNKEMANIATLIPGATERVIELKGAIRGMAVDVGKSTADLAQGGYQVISAFGDTADTVAILQMSAKAATAGVASTTEAINLLSAVTKGYGDTSKEAIKKASDLAFQTVTLGQTTFPELAASIGRVIPLTAELGVSQEELFAVMATGTGVTGKAAEVSTQLRGVMQALMAPSADMINLLKEKGYASGKAMLADLGLIETLNTIKSVSEASNMPLQKYISSIEGQTIALALTGSQADVYVEKLAAMRDSVDLTDVAFKEQTEGINKAGFAFQQAKIRIGVLGQEIGDRLLPMITPLIEKITAIVKKMSDWAKEHPGLSSGIVKVAAVLGPLLIGLGGVLIILPKLIALIPILKIGMIKLGGAFHFMLGPIGLIIAAIGAAIAVFIYFYKTSDKFRAFIDKIVAYIKEFVQNAWDRLVWLKDNWGALWKWIFEAIPKIAKNAFDNLITTLKWVWEFIKGWGSYLGKNFINVWRNLFSAIGTAVKNFGKNIWEQMKWIGQKMNPKNWFKKIERPDWTPLLEGFEAVWEEMPKIAELKLKKLMDGVEKFGAKMVVVGTQTMDTTLAIQRQGKEAAFTAIKMSDVLDKIIEKQAEQIELTEEEKKAIEARTEAEKRMLQDIFELLHTREEIEQKAFDERIKRLRELGVEEELIEKLIAARNAVIQEQITEKEAEEAEKRRVIAEKEAEEKAKAAEVAAERRIAAEERVTEKIFELTHAEEEISQRAFDQEIERLKELGISDELIQQLIAARRAKIQEEITVKEKEEANKRLEESEKEAEEKKRLAEEAADKRIAAEKRVTERIFALTHTREEVDQRQFDAQIERLRELGVTDELIQELIAARRAKIQEEITAKDKEEADEREVIAKKEADVKVAEAKRAAEKRMALEEEVTQKIFDFTHNREEIEQKAFDDYIARLEEMNVSDELIRELIAVRHAKLEEEKTKTEEEEAEKREKIAKDEEEEKAEAHRLALEKRAAAELSFRETMAKLMGDETLLLEIEIEKRIAQYQKEGWTEVEIQTWVKEFRELNEEEITAKLAEETKKRIGAIKSEGETVKKVAEEAHDSYAAMLGIWIEIANLREEAEETYEKFDDLFLLMGQGFTTAAEVASAMGQSVYRSMRAVLGNFESSAELINLIRDAWVYAMGEMDEAQRLTFLRMVKGLGDVTGHTSRMKEGLEDVVLYLQVAFPDAFAEMVEEIKLLSKEGGYLLWKEFYEASERIKATWDSVADTIRDSFETLVVDIIEGTKSMEEVWEDFGSTIKKAIVDALAKVLLEKLKLDFVLEANLLDWEGDWEGLAKHIRDKMGPALEAIAAKAKALIPIFRKIAAEFDEAWEDWEGGSIPTVPPIPSAQVGIPYVPITGPYVVHRKEAILNPPQAKEWRAGGGDGGGVTIGTVSLLLPSIRTAEDLERMSPAAWKRVFDKGLIKGMKMSAKEGKFSKEALMMN